MDVIVLIIAGFLSALSTLESPPICRGSAVAVALLYAAQLALCATVRPFTTLFAHVHTMFCIFLSVVSVCCQAAYLLAVDRGAELGALSPLLATAAVCDLVASAASIDGWLGGPLRLSTACWPLVALGLSQRC